MRAVLIILLQIVLAVILAGALTPLVLVAVPDAERAGPAVVGGVVGLCFVVLRFVWPRPRE
jgi:hypothetical protein